MALEHNSGGSYNMFAIWVKGSQVKIGKNALKRAAKAESELYPEICGFHAELDLYRQHPEMRGGTLYVAGRKNRSNAIMLNTKPCEYCSALLAGTRVNWVVYLKNGIFVKNRIDSL